MQGFLIKSSNSHASPEMNSFATNLVPGSYGAPVCGQSIFQRKAMIAGASKELIAYVGSRILSTYPDLFSTKAAVQSIATGFSPL